MRALLTAVGFLTRVPIPSRWVGEADLGHATVFFPVVGGLIGLLLLGVDVAAERLWHSAPVSNTLVIATLIVVTGGLHLDGLMDTCDGVFGGRSREQALAIMRDSRVGAYGVLGALVLLGLRFAFLFALSGSLTWRALILMAVAGRWALVYALVCFPSARAEGTGRALKDRVARGHLFWASLLAAALGASLFGLNLLPLAAVALLAAWAPARYLARRLGGLTGDTYGAIGEVAEVAVLAAMPLVAQTGWG
jgi:adenosylcobinamide-GDP ribazoletransferase